MAWTLANVVKCGNFRWSVHTISDYSCKHVDAGQGLKPAPLEGSTTCATRRGFGGTIVLGGALLLWASVEEQCAALSEQAMEDQTRDGPVVVFGAGGRVGRFVLRV